MATRQYIGARYVPKFFDDGKGSSEWVSGLTYEPLTVVTHLGNSFTSKKPVPVGVDILDTEYWCVTGNYNEQVENYREQVQTLINNRRKIIFIGDSYSVMPNLISWVDICANKLGLKLNESYFKFGKDGCAWVNDDNNTYLEGLKTLTINNPEFITDIVIGGGLNDINHTLDTISPAMDAFMTYVHENYKNAKVHLFIASRPKHANNMLTFIKDNGAYFSYSACGLNGIGFIDGSLGWIYDNSLLNETSHPANQSCENLIGWSLSNFLNGGSPYAYYRANKTTPVVHTDTPTTGNSYLISGCDGRGNKYIGLSIGILTPSSLQANTDITIGTCADSSINMVDASAVALNSVAIIKTSETSVIRNVSFIYTEGVLKYRIFGDVPTGTIEYVWVAPTHDFISDIYC